MDIPSYLLGKKAGGGGTPTLQTKEVEVTSNGSQDITADTGYDGLSKVELTTNVQPTLQTKSVSITSNGTTTISKDNDYDGMTSVSVTTNVQPDLESKSITINENTTTTITPTTGKDGLSSVSVITSIPQPTGTISITQNGTVDVTNYASADVSVSGGGTEVEEKDVNFYDYDGTRLYSYTTNEFLALQSMPANPTHEGLTAQGWNWSFQDAQDFVDDYKKLDIGQTYVTDDGSTRIYIHLDEGRTSPYLGFSINGTAIIDWGDGSPTQSVTGTSASINGSTIDTLHEYSAPGDYVITISSESLLYFHGQWGNEYGSHLLWDTKSSIESSNQVYQSSIIKVELGKVAIGYEAFRKCRSLKSVMLSNDVTQIRDNAFYDCNNLSTIIIPTHLTLNNGQYMFANCHSLSKLILPKEITLFSQSAFYQCYLLKKITLLNITILPMSCFNYCTSLSSVVFSKNLTTINSNAFATCSGVKYYDFSNCAQIPTLEPNAFLSIPSDCKIVVPDSLYDSWIVAQNWSTYTSYIISKSDWDAL